MSKVWQLQYNTNLDAEEYSCLCVKFACDQDFLELKSLLHNRETIFVMHNTCKLHSQTFLVPEVESRLSY